MGDLTLTGLDEAMLTRLNQRAAEHGQSIQAEVIQILEQQVGLASRSAHTGSTIWEKMAESRRQTGRLNVRTIDLLREDRHARDADECG